MLPTPSTSHVSYDTVYEPAEDSYLFLDTLSSVSEKAWLHARFSPQDNSINTTNKSKASPPPLLIELGPGSGVIVAFLTAHAEVIFGTEILSLGVDVNPYACKATRTTAENALKETKAGHSGSGGSVYLSSLEGDLTTPLKPGEVDVLVFNPPYVPTDSVPEFAFPTSTSVQHPAAAAPTFEESSHLLALSYAGGMDGMEVTHRLLRQIPDVLSQRGVAYVLFCKGNKPDEVKDWIRKWESPSAISASAQGSTAPSEVREEAKWKWCAETVGSSGKTAGWEKLEIVRIWREWT
jgi:release factor glutamine methyltransferase